MSARALCMLLFFLTGCPEAPEPVADLAAPADLAPDFLRRPLRSQEVTIIYPLPAAVDVDQLLVASSTGAYGRLVPLALFAQIPMPLDPRPRSRTSMVGAAGWNGLRLVSLRLDPCFGSRGEIPDASCKNQIRLVFQGVGALDTDSSSDDGAIHVLYELPRSELLSVAQQIAALTQRSGDYEPAPLGVHPVLRREGVRGAFAAGLRKLILNHLGERRIARLTFFARGDTLLSSWHFGAFDRSDTSFTRAEIATAGINEQVLLTDLPEGGVFRARTRTPTSHVDNLLVLIDGVNARGADAATRAQAFGAALRIENPLRHTPDTIDCLSCHVAQPARTLGEDVFGLSSAQHMDRYAGPGDLRKEPRALLSMENIHAASYLDQGLGLNQRTVNESAAVAEALQGLLLLPR